MLNTLSAINLGPYEGAAPKRLLLSNWWVAEATRTTVRGVVTLTERIMPDRPWSPVSVFDAAGHHVGDIKLHKECNFYRWLPPVKRWLDEMMPC